MPVLSTFLDTIFGSRCVLCNALGSAVCDPCWAQLPFRSREVVRSSEVPNAHHLSATCNLHDTHHLGATSNLHSTRHLPGVRQLSGRAVIDFNPQVSMLVHHYKELGRSQLAARFAQAMVGELLKLAEGSTQTLWLVGLPSELGSLQRRGFSPAALIANRALGVLEPRFGPRLGVGENRARSRAQFRVANGWVWRQGRHADQAGLSQTQRHQNLEGAMQASPRAAGRRVILIDDIVTTGSSLLETARALESAGAEIVGFVTFSETILRNIGKTPTKN